MQFVDFSPPVVPTLEQQRDALQKGLGRAWQWATAGWLADETLLDACVHDLRYDRQCEGNRGEWLWSLLNAAGAVDRLRTPILDAVQTLATEVDAYQLCQLALHYAQAGDDRFKDRLYGIAAQHPFPDDRWIGQGQLLALDGERALHFLAGVRGRQLDDREWDWDDDAIVSRAQELHGEEQTLQWINAWQDAPSRRFADQWKAQQQATETASTESYRERMEAVTASEIIEAAYGNGDKHLSMGWGRLATPGDLETVLHVLWTVDDPTVLVRLLQVFMRRALPRFDARLIELCQHADPTVQRWALKALEQNSDPQVRAFALERLHQPMAEPPPVGLLVRNFEKGDEQRLLDQVDLPDDSWLRHCLLTDILDLLEENADADRTQLGQIAYFHNPCELCRMRAVRLLVEHDHAPAWLEEECLHDSSDDYREFVKEEAKHSS